MNVFVQNCLFLQHFPYYNEELRKNNKPKNKRRRIYD